MKRSFRKIFPALTLVLGLVAFGSSLEAKPIVLNGIRAVVNGEPITQTMVDSAVETQVRMWLVENKGMVSRAEADREIKKMEVRALDDLIDRMLILSEFKRMGGNIKDSIVDEQINSFIKNRFGGDRAKFLEELKRTGMTIAQFREVQRDQIAINALRSQNSGDSAIPHTPWAKKKKYDEIKGKFASEGKVKLSIMSLPKEVPGKSASERAAYVKSLHSRLQKGADFGSIAKKESQDSFASKGGYVGAIGRDTLNPALTQLAYDLPSGRVSPLIDDGPFWRILKSNGRVGQSVPSFEKLEDEVEQRLTMEQRQEYLEVWLKKLRRDANVRLYD